MLDDLGMRIESHDLVWCYYCFNCDSGKYITLKEFMENITLSEHEIDIHMDYLRQKILKVALVNETKDSNKTSITANITGNKSTTNNSQIAPNKLRDNRIFSRFFQYINISKSGILSVDEFLEFTSKIDMYLSEDEAKDILKSMDTNNNQKVEETEFIDFMKQTNMVLLKKADRINNAADKLRKWLLQGQVAGSAAMNSTMKSASTPTRSMNLSRAVVAQMDNNKAT